MKWCDSVEGSQKSGIQSRVMLLNQPPLQFEPQPEIEPESPIELLANVSQKIRVKEVD